MGAKFFLFPFIVLANHSWRLFEKIFYCLFRIFGNNNTDVILFESYPEFSGSPWMIYKELIKRNYDKKYKLIWVTGFPCKPPSNIQCIPYFGCFSLRKKISALRYLASAKIIINSNRPLKKLNPKTVRVFTRHGGTLKNCIKYMHTLGEIDFLLSLSSELKKIDYVENQGHSIRRLEDILVLGYPANDELFVFKDLYLNGFYPKLCSLKKDYRFKKIIGWLPTFRQRQNFMGDNSLKKFPFGLPLVQNEAELMSLNSVLEERNILLVVQMHHAQAKNFTKRELSNIVLVSDNLKKEMSVSTANMLQSFDALITDYSAVYYEFILLNRPIALTIDDYKEYNEKPGFSINYFNWVKGVYLQNTTDLVRFIEDVYSDKDSEKTEREKALRRIHKYTDDQSTKRVVDFFANKSIL